jgi:hypothetical protein
MSEPLPKEIEDPLKENLVCRQEIPLRWRKLEGELSDSEIMMIHNDNLKFMEVLLSGEDTADVEQHRDKEVLKELHKIDAKLNLLMNWFSRIIWQQQEFPTPQTVDLSAKGLQFVHNDQGSGEEVVENDELFIEMFLEPRYPQPFITLAKVLRVNTQPQGREVLVRFIHLSEQTQEWLNKYVFRLHRRQVALARKSHTVFR